MSEDIYIISFNQLKRLLLFFADLNLLLPVASFETIDSCFTKYLFLLYLDP